MTEYVWRGLEHGSLERLSLRSHEGLIVAESTVGLTAGVVDYVAVLGADFTFQTLGLEVPGTGRRLTLDRTTRGAWAVDGRSRPDLAGAFEIDLAVSPFTNTLPIRRLGLAVGESADITTAYVDFPSLEVLADPQRYTRLAATTYRYESRDTDFTREIMVDDDGLVLDYPGLFVRLE